jgi:hypothetical protein
LDEADGGLTQFAGGPQPFDWAGLVPVGYAEKSMASLMQLHSELLEEKERRVVDLYQRLMDKEQVLAELRMYVKLLEEKLAQTSVASRPEGMTRSEPEAAVAPQPKLRPPTPPRPPNPNRPRISVRVRPMDQRSTRNGVAQPVITSPRRTSPPPVPRSLDPSDDARPSPDGWRTW